MQMIIAVDLLANVDCLYKVNDLIPYSQVDIQDMHVRIVSQVIHGARTIRILQGEVVFTGILGGFIGKYIKHHMDIRKTKSDIIWAEIETPHEIKIVDKDMEISSVQGMELRFPMPAALCSYCLGETRIGEAFQMGNVRKMDLGDDYE